MSVLAVALCIAAHATLSAPPSSPLRTPPPIPAPDAPAALPERVRVPQPQEQREPAWK